MKPIQLTRVGPCRVCGAENWHTFLDLGQVPLANSFMTDPSVTEECFPLALMSCRVCRLVSLTHVVDAGHLYDHYCYLSPTSRVVHTHMAGLVWHFERELGLDSDSFVVEIGSNNGDQLAKFEPFGCALLGVEPAQNIAEQARDRGIDTLGEFFTADLAARVRAERGPADLVLARHVIEHVDDLHGLIAGVRDLLAPDGLFALEVPYLVELMTSRSFDAMYHEHLSHFLVGTLRRLLETSGLRVIDVAEFDVHGGSIVLTAALESSRHETNVDNVDTKIAAEVAAGMYCDDTYDDFVEVVDDLRSSLRTTLRELTDAGYVVAGYGASAMGVTLLTTSRVPPDTLEFCSDTTPEKQGTWLPELRTPVISPEEARARRPNVYVLLARNYRDEILLKEADFLNAGGRFLIPIPEPELVGAAGSVVPIGAAS